MAVILWIGLGVMGLLLDAVATAGHQYSEFVTASLSLLFGIWAFWTHGGPRVTAAGLYSLAMSVYVGFAGLWWVWSSTITDEIYIATVVGYWTTIGMYFFFWKQPQDSNKLEMNSSAVARWGLWIGFMVCIGGFALGLVGLGNPDQLALGGLAFLMVALILRVTRGEKILKPAIAAGVVVASFWFFIFSGGGRLNLVVLALIGVVVVSMRAERRRLKALILIAATPMVMLLGWIEMMGARAETVGEGLASVVNPLKYFGELVVAHGHEIFQLGGGEAFLTTAFFWIPESIWPDKPEGFGAVLSDLLRPDLAGTNNSLAALSFGDWFYDFGWLGIGLMVLIVGIGIRLLDNLAGRVGSIESRSDFLYLVVITLLVAGIPTFAWVGSFTYVTRSVQQLLPLLILALPWASKTTAIKSESSNATEQVGRRGPVGGHKLAHNRRSRGWEQ